LLLWLPLDFPSQGLLLSRTVDCVLDEQLAHTDKVRYDMQCTTSKVTRRNLTITFLVAIGIVMFTMVGPSWRWPCSALLLGG
jgi:hypothetical protein